MAKPLRLHSGCEQGANDKRNGAAARDAKEKPMIAGMGSIHVVPPSNGARSPAPERAGVAGFNSGAADARYSPRSTDILTGRAGCALSLARYFTLGVSHALRALVVAELCRPEFIRARCV